MPTDFPKFVTNVEMAVVLGVSSPPPSEVCAKDGRPGEKTVVLQAWPNHGKLYLVGVRAFYDVEEDADITFEIQHPRTKAPLVGNGPIPGIAMNPEHAACRRRFPHVDPESMLLPIFEKHVEDAVEPVYCSRDEPLLIVATGTVFAHLAIWGATRYSVTKVLRPYGCGAFEELGYFEGPFPYSQSPKMLGDPEG